MRRTSFLIVSFLFLCVLQSKAQHPSNMPAFGVKDTVAVTAIYFDGEWMPYQEMEMVYVSKLSSAKLAKVLAEYDRLRRAVYVTYHYAQTAGAIINDVSAHLKNISSKKEIKKYIKSRESELKKQFSDPLSNLSVTREKF